MPYPEAAWERAMTVQEVMLKAIGGEIHWFRAAEILGWSPRTLRRWVRQVERDSGVQAGLTTDERQRLQELEREKRELRRANEILRTASACFAQAELDRRAR